MRRTVAFLTVTVAGLILASTAPALGHAANSNVRIVQGIVKDTSGKPIEGITVAVFASDVDPWEEGGSDRDTTDASGRFWIPVLDADRIKVVAFSMRLPYAAVFSGGGYSKAGAQQVDLTDGGEWLAFRLPAAVTLRGKVTNPSGLPLVGASVSAELGRTGEPAFAARGGETTGGGGYALTGLPPGYAAIRAVSQRSSLVPTYLPSTEDRAAAQLIGAGAGATRAVPALRVRTGAVVYGKVTSSAPISIADTTVRLRDLPIYPAAEPDEISGDGGVNYDGTYRITGVPAGTYHPVAVAAGSGVTFLGNTRLRSQSTPLVVPSGGSARADFAIRAGSGNIRTFGLPGSSTCSDMLAIYDIEGTQVGRASWSPGGFPGWRSTSLAPGQYLVAHLRKDVGSWTYATDFLYDRAWTFGDATPVTVAAKGTTTITLHPPTDGYCSS